MKILKKDYFKYIEDKISIFLFCLTIFSCFSLFMQKYIINGQDFMFHFSRLEGVIDNIKVNNLFNGLYYNQLNGYGYATPLFYADIFLYFPALLVLIGISKYNAYKIFLFIISYLSISFMYLAIKSITNNKRVGIVISVLYAASSYRLTDLFERCALGEIITFVFLPLVFWGIYEIVYRDKNKYWLLVIGMSGLILSHLITSVLTFFVLLVICLFNVKKLFKEKQRIVSLVYSVLFTILITSYFLFPFLEQMSYQKYSVNYVMDSFSINDYTTSVWRLLFVIPGIVYCELFNSAWLPAGLGIGFVIILIIILKAFVKNEVKDDNNFWKLILVIGIIGLLFSTNLFPWDLWLVKKMFSFMQFPWRILSIATVLILMSFGIYYNKSKYLNNNLFVNIIIILAIPTILIFNVYNLSSIYLQDTLGSDFETLSCGEYLPISDVVTGWGSSEDDYYYDRESIAVSEGNINLDTTRKDKYLFVNYSNNSDSNEVILPLLYYKGYDIKVNNRSVKYFKSSEGLIKVNVDNDSGKIVAYYKGTDTSYYTKIISLISIIVFVILVIKQIKRSR